MLPGLFHCSSHPSNENRLFSSKNSNQEERSTFYRQDQVYQGANHTICISVGENNVCFLQWRQWLSEAEKKKLCFRRCGWPKKISPGRPGLLFFGFFEIKTTFYNLHWTGYLNTTSSLVFDTFIWSYQRQRKNVLPIILCCQKEMDGDCVLRFPDISTSLFSHACVSVNSAENKRGIWVWKKRME